MKPQGFSNGDYDTSPFVTEFYDHVEQYRRRDDIPFLVQAAVATSGPVLELGCGTGRTLIPTAEAGVEIAGVDRSSHMLHACRLRLRDLPAEVRSRARLIQADIRNLDFSEEFSLVTAPFRVFQFLHTIDDQLACLACVHQALRPGGTLVLDLSYPSAQLFSQDNIGVELAYEPEFAMPDGRRVHRRHRFITKDLLEQFIAFHVIYVVTHPDGRQERLIQRFRMRYLYRFEVEHLLARSGFEVRHIWADYDRSPFGSKENSELIIEASRV